MWREVVDGDLADIKDLVENGRDVNRRDGSDRTPLDYCVRTVGSKISYARTRVVENDNNIIIIIIQYFTRTYTIWLERNNGIKNLVLYRTR